MQAQENADIEKMLREEARWRAKNATRLSAGAADADWCNWLEWADNRWRAADESGWGCTERVATCAAEYVACKECDGCAGLVSFLRAWEASNPEPRTSLRGACT